MTTVYLIRHAQAEGNYFRRIHGQYDSPVTALGRRQIACLQARFADIAIDAVYASDLKRTCQTAEAIYVPKHLELHREPGLREINLGEWEDQPFGKIYLTQREEMIQFQSGIPTWSAPGGETLRQVTDRVEKTLRRIISENPGKTIAVFSHGTAIRNVLSRLLKRPETPEGYLPEGDNTSVACLEAEGEEIRVKWYNDASHLTPEVLAASTRPNRGGPEMEKRAPIPNLFWFRPWDPDTERQRYLDYRREGWLSSHGTMEHFDGPAFLDAALKHSRFDPAAVLIVMSDTEPAGILEMDFERGADQGVGAIPFYYVDPQHRKRGDGVQLLGQAVSSFRAMGRSAIRLRCAPENGTAYRFYIRNGFQKIGMASDSVVPLYLMERPI